MSEIKRTIFPPLTLSPAVLKDGRSAIQGFRIEDDAAVLVVYDRGTRVGGVYDFDQAMWRLYSPIEFKQFLGGIVDKVRLPDGADLQTWLDAVGGGTDPH